MQAFVECGWPAWVVLLGVIVALPIAATALALAIHRKRTAPVMALLALSIGMAPYGCGTVGEVIGRSQVDAVLSGGSVDPVFAEEIRVTGYAEAAQCRKIGLGGSALPGLVALVALGLAFARRDPAAPPIVPPRG